MVKFLCKSHNPIREMTSYFFHGHEHLENDQTDK